jgi:hypothetical protein
MKGGIELSSQRVRDQGSDVNCCTSCALAACLEALQPDGEALSPLFHYHLSRPGGAGNSGMTDTAALAGAYKYGLCVSRLHPTAHEPEPVTLAAVEERPSGAAIDDGRTRWLRGRRPGVKLWRRIRRTDAEREWKLALDRKHPVFVGILLEASYRSMKGGAADTWRPQKAFGLLPGHAVALLGYDDAARRFIVQDSRGTSFGRQGRWFLPYESVASNAILDSFEILSR